MPFTLSSKLVDCFRLTMPQKTALHKLGLETISDLLYHFPSRYGDSARARSIDMLAPGENVVVNGVLSGLKTDKGWRSRIPMGRGYIEDETGRIQCVWFNQPYIAKMFSDGIPVRIEGRVSERCKTGELYMSNPQIERLDRLPTGTDDSLFGSEGDAHALYPSYPESRGITSLWIYHTTRKILKSAAFEEMAEPLPTGLLEGYNLPGIKTAMIWMHSPQKREDALAARKRFSFEEMLKIQLDRLMIRRRYEVAPAFKIEPSQKNMREFVSRFPFQLTEAQTRAIEDIIADMGHDRPMSRLLEGDVGSGKTAVAAAAAHAVISMRRRPPLQTAYMCPTEILAIQHFESFIKFFSHMPVSIALITGSGCRKFPSKVDPLAWTDISRAQLLKWVASGEINVVIGTHALIQKSVVFRDLAMVIIDEQHRFGTAQRASLVGKNAGKNTLVPHLLSMTATPIPRTLALTLYGDLDLTLLDQSPSGRKPVETELVTPEKRAETYEKIRHELSSGRQLYVICPRIDEPDPDKASAIVAKSVKKEAADLKEKIFPEFVIDVLHGQMTPDQKNAALNDFRDGKTNILCATSVVEVGMNVPNATVIVIEGAERFGLAQLHQLRGRVMRSTRQAYCYAFTETSSVKSIDRLKALINARNGFELAELDLSQRGAGSLSGIRQWGISDIAMDALSNLKLVEAARTEAAKIIEKDPTLVGYPLLQTHIKNHKSSSHFE